MAWLYQIPDGAKASRISKEGSLEDVEATAEHVRDYFIEISETTDTISYQELNEWGKITGIELNPWEAGALVKMFAAYRRQLTLSKDPRCESPVDTPEMKQKRKMKSLMSHMRGLKAGQRKRKNG